MVADLVACAASRKAGLRVPRAGPVRPSEVRFCDERDRGMPAAGLRRPADKQCRPPASQGANGDARIVEHEARLVVDEAAREAEGRSGIVVALVAALIGGAHVVLV